MRLCDSFECLARSGVGAYYGYVHKVLCSTCHSGVSTACRRLTGIMPARASVWIRGRLRLPAPSPQDVDVVLGPCLCHLLAGTSSAGILAMYRTMYYAVLCM